LGAFSSSQSHQLVSRKYQDTKHPMAHHFDTPVNPECITAELILKPSVTVLGHDSLVVTDCIDRFKFFVLIIAAQFVVNQRHVIRAMGMLVQQATTIGGIHSAMRTAPRFQHQETASCEHVLLQGEARLRFEDSPPPVSLLPGDYLDIAAHRRHRVEWTHPDLTTVWLAIHYQAN
jgi:hypothetical protein